VKVAAEAEAAKAAVPSRKANAILAIAGLLELIVKLLGDTSHAHPLPGGRTTVGTE
jgi:hypothetical protein